LTVTKPQNATLIDSISEGYAAINRRLWVVLIPIALNLFLWFGPQLSLGPLITGTVNLLRDLQPDMAQQEDVQLVYDRLLAMGGVDVREQLAWLNDVPTLQRYVVGADIASELPATPAEVQRPIDTTRGDVIEIGSVGGALLALLAINTVALALSAVFFGQVGATVRRDQSPLMGLRRAPRIALFLLAALGIIVGVALVIGLPMLFFITLLLYLNQTLGLLVAFALYWLAVWVSIYIGFMREGIVISGLGPLRAIYTSFNVVRRNLWATLGFLAITLVIRLGSGVIWHSLVNSTIGLTIAIIGSAYIGSGLMAARMAFYRERLRRWQSAPNPQGLRARN